ncbi:MAG: family 78 glycoside hydrolase catalytic domain [Clostridiales bacterium]|nr:family 78 glycoside hydrolase catalytic domain [Clostridiales bacterium]
MRAIRLKTEYLPDPTGIDITTPRLFWNCEGGVTQTAYQVVCRDENDEILWDSDKVSSISMRVRYGGAPLNSRARVAWAVRLWDENDRPGDWSETAHFELGLLSATDWTAQWITGDYRVNKKLRYPVDCFRKTFETRQVKKARLYVTACGLYEGRLNGARVGNFVLAPGHTDYCKRVQYQTYDVTDLLRDGANELTFHLADGWYRGSCGAWGLRNQYGTETKLLAQLELTLADGGLQTIATDGAWAWSNDGPIRFADNQDGEVVEAWRAPSYAGRAKVTEHPVTPTASNNVPITEHERLTPALITTPSGKTVLDFGQNIAGYVEFSLTAKLGQRVFLRLGEMLDENGEFTQKNIQLSMRNKTTPLQQVEYFCREGENHYKTRFAIFGFQYALVETDVSFHPENFTAIAVYSDLETTARFESSNPLLNKLVENTLWSTKNNSADVPTDCPTRERHGWTGDSQLFAVTAGYLMNYIPFAKKHIRDLTDWQRKDGCFPQIAPYGGVDSYMNTLNGSVGWADAGVLIPYRYWKLFGDEDFIRDNYDAMARYARFMMKRCGKPGLFAKPLGLKGKDKKYAVNAGQSYGEWAEPADVYPNKWTDMVAPHPEVSTAYTAYVMGVMAEIAEALGKTKDVPLYREYQQGCTAAYQELVETKGYSLDTDRQARLVRPLYFGLLNEVQTDYAKNRLIQALERYQWRVGTGFLSTPLILYVLADIDIKYAYRLLENEEMPGWLFMPKSGATTIWESWESTCAQGGIASLNHYSKGAVCEWLFTAMCGIQVAGENRFIIAPRPGGHFTQAGLSYDSIYGTVESRWEQTNGRTVYTVTVPANCTAEISLSGGTAKTVGAGIHTFEEATT